MSGIVIGKFRRWLTVLLVMQALTGCGYIKSLFPDKERDYQFRTEIPELIVPEDLKGKTLPERTPEQMAAAAVTAAEQVAGEQAAPTDELGASAAASQKETEVGQASEDKPAALVASGNSAVSSLQIDQPQKLAWRLVARALSRQRMEIVERNIDKGYFYVNYDPRAIKPEDGSLWDEVTFMFGDDPSNEKEYRITLQQIAPQVTEVTVQDSSGTTLSDDVATALLKLITDGINQTLPEKTEDGAAEQTPTETEQENPADNGKTENPQDNPGAADSPEKPQDNSGDSAPAL